MRKAWFCWELTSKGRFAPSVCFDSPPGELAVKTRAAEFRPIIHPITDPELLAQVNASDGGSMFAALALAFPAPAVEPEPIATRIETEAA